MNQEQGPMPVSGECLNRLEDTFWLTSKIQEVVVAKGIELAKSSGFSSNAPVYDVVNRMLTV